MRQRHFSMQASMKSVVLLAAAGLLVSSLPARTQNLVKNKELFAGQAIDVEGIRLGAWGSGRAREDTTKKSIGDTSIRVDTNGYYAGGRIEFNEPRDITEQKSDPYGFLAFTIFFQPGTRKPPRNSVAGYPGSGGAPGFSGEGAPPALEGAPSGFPMFPGAPSGGGEEEQIQPDTSKIKVVLTCEEGTFVASNFPVTLVPASEEGWFQVAIPFVAFKGLDKVQTCKIREIRIFGDTRDTFWIGEIRTTTDEEPISVEPLEDAEVAIQEPVEFRASATGGISPLQYSWDFDLSDGLQEDAVGPVVVHVFRNASKTVPGGALGDVQPYVVTLTVKDLSGAKRPVRRTANVIVNP